MGTPIEGSLEYWANKKPDEPAIIEENGFQLTWDEWNRRSNSLAEALVRRGIKPKDIVAVRSHIRHEWFVVNRALSKLGCSTLTINWRLTPAEVKYMIEDSGAKALILDDDDPISFMEEMKDTKLNFYATIGVNHQDPRLERYEDFIEIENPPERFFDGTRTSRIVYTSGTTGKSKGVYLPISLQQEREKEIMEYMHDMERVKAVPFENSTLLTLPLHHGAGPHSADQAHKKGKKVVLLRRFHPEKALQLIEKYKITTWSTVPTMLKRVASLPKSTLEKYDVSSITFISCGAAPVPVSLKRWAMEYFGENCVYVSYGSTETGLVSLLTPEHFKEKIESVGMPYKHIHISVRDENGNELPPGEQGELWIKSPMNINQYLNRPKLERDTLDEKGFFRVGDVGYLDKDGFLYITDRKKDMIISGGVNIYPAEIESVLIKHPAIQDVAVFGIPHDEFGEQVKALCELKPGYQVDENELIEFSKKELASFKIPRSIEFVDELPRNTMGKILKNKLREYYWKEMERKI